VSLKGFDLVIRAVATLVKEFPKIRLVILGKGPEKQNLENLAQSLGVKKHVDFRGFIKNTSEIINHSEIFVLSSFYEGFGNVIVEAMGVGTPVIATNCPYGPGEIITHGKNGILTEVGKSDEIAAAIKKLFLNKDLYEKIQQNGFELVKDFTPKKIAKQHELLFEKIIQE
jgi:glycosyltransferase involved in cell wall biosynthesis